MSNDEFNEKIYTILQKRDEPREIRYYVYRLAECNEALEKINNRDDVFRIALLDSRVSEYAPILDLMQRIKRNIEDIMSNKRLAISQAESKTAGAEIYGIPYEDRQPGE